MAVCLLTWPPVAMASDIWPEIMLPTPKDPAVRKYLGIDNDAMFTLDRIKAKAVIVQIYSMYCPICQREADRVNQLSRLITQDSTLSRQVKIIAIGAGNTDYEVEFYRKTYNVPFPLFADGEFNIHRQLGEVRTPYFYVLTPGRDQTLKIVYSKAGGFKSAQLFLDSIKPFLE